MKDKIIFKATRQQIHIKGANDVDLLNIAKAILNIFASKHGLVFRSDIKDKHLTLELIKEEKQ